MMGNRKGTTSEMPMWSMKDGQKQGFHGEARHNDSQARHSKQEAKYCSRLGWIWLADQLTALHSCERNNDHESMLSSILYDFYVSSDRKSSGTRDVVDSASPL